MNILTPAMEHTKIAIIGAGLAGLSCARELTKVGYQVTLFDKSKHPGGRASSRLFEQWSIDHGAQYFTAKTPLFQSVLKTWVNDEIVMPWNGKIIFSKDQSRSNINNLDQRFISVPSMNSLSEYLAKDLSLMTGITISGIQKFSGGWALCSKEKGNIPGLFDVIVIAIPPKQAHPLLKNTTPRLQNLCSTTLMLPCWTLIAYFSEVIDLPFDGAFLEGSIFSWIARNNSKPKRPAGEAWVAQANPEWSMENLEKSNYEVESELLYHFEMVTGKTCNLYQSHLWRYAKVASPLRTNFEFDKTLGLGLCGDWFINSTIEGAWTSGHLLANQVIETYQMPKTPIKT